MHSIQELGHVHFVVSLHLVSIRLLVVGGFVGLFMNRLDGLTSVW